MFAATSNLVLEEVTMRNIKLPYLMLTLLLGVSVSPAAEMPILWDDFEHDGVGASVPVKCSNPFFRDPSVKGVQVVGESGNPAGTGLGLQLKDDSGTEAVYVEYEFARVTDNKSPASGYSAVRVDLNFSPVDSSGDGSSHILITLSEHPMIRLEPTDAQSGFLDCRLKNDGTIDFHSSDGPGSTGHKLNASSNSLSIFANDLDSKITYTGLDNNEHVLPADSVAYWLNGRLIEFDRQGYVKLENKTINTIDRKGKVTGSYQVHDTIRNISRLSLYSGAQAKGLHYVFDNILVSDFDFMQSDKRATSSLVYEGRNGLEYKRYANKNETNKVNTVPDYSSAGYQGGGVAIPAIPEAVRVRPGGSDDTTSIQAAIDSVSKMPLGENGFRGAVVLEAGAYSISQSLKIQASGVVVRGAGSQQSGGTTITMTVNDIAFRAENPSDDSESKAAADTVTPIAISEDYVPAGATTFKVSDASSLKVGDRIVIQLLYNDKWIADIGMRKLWKAKYYEALSHYPRVITAIDGKSVTVHSPVIQAIQTKYGGGQISKSPWDKLESVGIEGIRCVRLPSIKEVGGAAVRFNDVRNGWVRQVTSVHFNANGVIVGDSEQVTVEDCAFLDPYGTTMGGQRYSFAVGGTANHVLFQRCLTRAGRHDFVSGKVHGPNVWVDCRATETWSEAGPHHRWSTGELYDNIMCGDLAVKNRAKWNNKKGHGWTGGQVMFWNCDARTLLVEAPTGSMNWAVGCRERRSTGGDDNPDVGMWDSENEPVTPRSLYYAQLADRLGEQALNQVIVSQQRAGHIWAELLRWDGDGHFGDALVAYADQEADAQARTAFPVHISVRNLALLDGSPKVSWRKLSGPGTVTFEGDGLDKSMVTASRAGTYELEVTVDDGVTPASARVAVTVK